MFISSGRRGLEEERDALPGLIAALGHEAIRFEDFTAMAIPSRQACLEGVAAADVYLLVLGPYYGEPLADTGRAPTEEEFTAARSRGIPVLAFRKDGVALDNAQRDFLKRVEDYSTGHFRRSFSSSHELLTQVAEALRTLSEMPPRLEWSRLPDDVAGPDWVVSNEQSGLHTTGVTLELHLLPVGPVEWLRVQELDSLGAAIAQTARATGFFSAADALRIEADGQEMVVEVRPPATPFKGVRIRRNRTATCWTGLPRDGLGTIVDRQDLTERLADMVRHLAATRIPRGSVSFGLSLAPIEFVSEGSIENLGRRSQASIGIHSADAARVPPEDFVPAEVLEDGAPEIAAELASRLLHAFRRARGN